MKKYMLVMWPEIQDFMGNPDYNNKVYYDSEKDVYFVPEDFDIWPLYEEDE